MVLQGWGTVVSALARYSSGKTSGSRMTLARTAHEMEDGAGAFLFLREMTEEAPSGFVLRLAYEACERLQHSSHWDKSYDYDGQGVFFKTTVSFVVLDRGKGVYGLGFYAAYVGEKVEREFAEAYKIPLALIHATAEIKTMPDEASGRFSFDCDYLLARLGDVFPVSLRGEDMAQQMVSISDRHSDPQPAQVYATDLYTVKVGIDSITVEPHWREPWRAEGALVTGHLRRKRGEEGYEQPTLYLSIRKRGKDDTRDEKDVFWQEQEKTEAREVLEKVVTALQA